MTFGTRNKRRGWRVDPASVTHPDFQRALERIRRYLGADPAAVVAAGIRRGWCAYPDNIPTMAVPCLNQGNPG
jgi:hypothetical protein